MIGLEILYTGGNTMSICMVGVDYEKASVDVRALFAFTKKQAAAGLEELLKDEKIYGALILSTCNRMEIWAHMDGTPQDLFSNLCALKEVQEADARQYFVFRQEQEAVEHLFFMACGLKSQILAEDQIITQVKDALALARECYATDNVLEVLFRKAVTAAKRVKTEVVFSRANETAMDKALALLEDQGFSVKGKICMVIGNGEMGKLAAQTLQRAGADVTVTVRQYRSGVVEIPRGCKRINYGERMEFFPQCDLVVSATASPNFTLTRELVAASPAKEELILIDLAVPRDMEPSIGSLPGIALYNIDDFKTDRITPQVRKAMDQAEKILREVMEEFTSWREGRNLIPRIQKVQEEAMEDLNFRLHKLLVHLPMEEKEKKEVWNIISNSAGKVVTKLIFGLRDYLDKDTFLDCMEGLEKVYEEDGQ